MIKLTINGTEYELDVADDMPLLWAIRDHAKLTGTKFGCGVGLCSACTVHLDGQPVQSCSTPVSLAAGKQITTIEGIGETAEGKAIQEAWKTLEVVQCGYCQPGQIMSAAALLKHTPKPGDTDIDKAMGNNICRCNTYHRIRAGIHAAAEKKSA
ncbi:MAG: (2Fe-2S)-binding protein [Candidatus Electrothrix sp. Rat3]|nr:(2Fe-2S)-binding protein [Candidatus Electrothrix rattekaaiensis]